MTYRARNVVIAVGLALVAMLLTLLYVTNYKRSVQQSQTKVQVYVAAHDIAAGATGADLVGGHAFRLADVTRSSVVPGAISSPDQVESLVVASPIYAGEQVTLRRFTDVAAEGIRAQLNGTMRAIQVAGDPNQLLAGTLQAGDRVDVVANLHETTATGDADATRTVLRDISVLVAPKPTSSSVSEVSPSTESSVILAVTDSQALRLFFVVKNADWSLELRPVGDATDGPDQVDTMTTMLGGAQ
jgi:Flp pilus assembly protein CpaB